MRAHLANCTARLPKCAAHLINPTIVCLLRLLHGPRVIKRHFLTKYKFIVNHVTFVADVTLFFFIIKCVFESIYITMYAIFSF